MALTSLRFFAALHVVLFHSGQHWFRRIHAPHLLENLRATGYVAVTFFFLLSGFILTYNHVDGPALRPRAFFVARFARIYPVYLFSLLLALVPALFVSGFSLPVDVLVANLLLVQSFAPSTLSWNLPSWSISDEAFFYLTFPAIAAVLARLLARPMRARWRLLGAMGALWLTSGAASLLYMYLDPDGIGARSRFLGVPAFRRYANLLSFLPPIRLPEFLMGACLGALFLEDRALGIRRRGDLWAGAAALALVAVLALSDGIPFPLLHNALLAPLFALLIYGVAHGSAARSPAARALQHPVLVRLGEASYGLYILQLPVALIFLLVTGGDVGADMKAIAGRRFLAYLAVLLLVSLVTHRWLERPAQRLLRRAFGAG